MGPNTLNLLSGAAAGSTGVFVSFPFDTLKTLSQTRKVEGNVVSLVKSVYRTDGVQGFYGGVRGMVVGQALIKR